MGNHSENSGKSQPRTPDDQLANFQKAAREAGCNEDEASFDAKLRQIAKHKPKPADEAEAKNDKAPE